MMSGHGESHARPVPQQQVCGARRRSPAVPPQRDCICRNIQHAGKRLQLGPVHRGRRLQKRGATFPEWGGGGGAVAPRRGPPLPRGAEDRAIAR